ncbi:hypothetical protein DYB37_010967 [Aphanomyces astaci]|uniref:Uncharacterized protein n=2 Tax=Aphanomyces astaci TaxID=112090 RepID=A0A418ERS8_APHAT|nr:hypothetical protein DYB37_010967 [Aphanomyces astaci]
MRSLRGYIDTVSKSFAPLDAALTEWYEAHGISRVFKLFASLPQLRDLVIAHAVFSANLPLLKMLPVELLCAVPYQLLDLAALNGRVAVLDFLRATLGHEEGTPWEAALPAGECGGYLDIVCCLHDRRSKDGSKRAVVLAAEYGHVEVVQFIHTHNPDTDTFQEALTTAATHNQLDVVACIIDLLGTSRRGFTAPMDAAASHGHLEMVKLLNQHDFPSVSGGPPRLGRANSLVPAPSSKLLVYVPLDAPDDLDRNWAWHYMTAQKQLTGDMADLDKWKTVDGFEKHTALVYGLLTDSKEIFWALLRTFWNDNQAIKDKTFQGLHALVDIRFLRLAPSCRVNLLWLVEQCIHDSVNVDALLIVLMR